MGGEERGRGVEGNKVLGFEKRERRNERGGV